MKHRNVHALQKYLLNPPIKLLFAVGVAPPGRPESRVALQLATLGRLSVLACGGARHESRLRSQY